MEKQQPLTPEVLVPRVGNYLVEKGLISIEDLNKALEIQQERTKQNVAPLLGAIMVEMEIVDRTTLDAAITEQILQLRTALQEANNELEQRVAERTAELQKALTKLSELDRLKSDFISNISHELRTPLTHIKGYLELLSALDLGPLVLEQVEALKVMEKASNRLENLIEDLILFSNIQRGNIQLEKGTIELQDFFNKIVDRIKPAAQAKQINIQTDYQEGIPAVYADPERIGWVLMQLLENAIKFSSNYGLVVLKATQFDDKHVQISVSDHGIGIPADKIQEIFEPFHQLDGTSTRKHGGTGMGLTLVRDILNAHHTSIVTQSEVNKGSTFSFVLPIAGLAKE